MVATSCHGAAGESSEAVQTEAARESGGSELEWAEARSAQKATATRLPGEVVTPPQAAVTQGPPVEAVILEWQVAPGESVEVGEPLARIRSPELADLKADVRRFRGRVEEWERVVEQRRANVESGFQTATKLVEAEVALSEARARLRASRRRVAARRGDDLEPDGAREEWVASAAGRVGRLRCAAGRLLEAGRACVELVADRRAEVAVDVPQRLSRRIGEEVEAVWRPFGVSRQEAGRPLELVRRAARLSSGDHTRTYYFRASNGEGDAGEAPGWTVGQSGYATLQVSAPEGAILVPRRAVTRMGNDRVVFTRKDGKPRAVRVELLGQYDTDYLVRGEGLEAGMSVVADGAFNLKSRRVLE